VNHILLSKDPYLLMTPVGYGDPSAGRVPTTFRTGLSFGSDSDRVAGFPCHPGSTSSLAGTEVFLSRTRVHSLRVPKTCATWAKALQSAVERSACAGPVVARPEVG